MNRRAYLNYTCTMYKYILCTMHSVYIALDDDDDDDDGDDDDDDDGTSFDFLSV